MRIEYKDGDVMGGYTGFRLGDLVYYGDYRGPQTFKIIAIRLSQHLPGGFTLELEPVEEVSEQ